MQRASRRESWWRKQGSEGKRDDVEGIKYCHTCHCELTT